MDVGVWRFESFPSRAESIGAYFEETNVGGQHRTLITYPQTSRYEEPTFVRYACGLRFQSTQGERAYTAGDLGQVVLSERRILGIVTEGTAADRTLSLANRTVFGFSIERTEFRTPEPKTNWRGKPVAVTIRAENAAEPYLLQVFSVVATINNDGQGVGDSIESFLRTLR